MGAPKIDNEHPLLNRDIILNLSNGMSHTLKLMANVEAEFTKPFSDPKWNSPKEISVVMVLDTPFYAGHIMFHFDKMVAKKIIENMIGAEVDENSDEILDGVGEISNIFYGAAKTKIKEQGFDLNMSIPKPYLTKDLPALVSKSVCMIIPFKIENKDCFVEIVLF
jgi:chemotaxis protein CheX